ncbi:MAG: hypothetical protein H6581_14970 [Bacteroidia bacterium]|nr:hypothetical protein [Bacteroidia bacterium]
MGNSFAFGTTFLFGLLHGLEPGHGKTVMAAFLLGEKMRWKHLFAMAGSLIFSHFALLIILAFALNQLMDLVQSEVVFEVIEWVAPLIVIGFGSYLFWKYSRPREDGKCACGHDHAGPHLTQLGAPAQPQPGQMKFEGLSLAPTETNPTDDQDQKSFRKATLAGMVTGFIPCPTSLAPLLVAGAAGSFAHIVAIIGTYMLGMGLILLTFLSLFFIARDFITARLERFEGRINTHLLSAGLIIVVGFVYLGLNFLPHSH